MVIAQFHILYFQFFIFIVTIGEDTNQGEEIVRSPVFYATRILKMQLFIFRPHDQALITVGGDTNQGDQIPV